MQDDVAKAFGELIEKARLVSRDAARVVEEILKEGIERPLDVEEARALLTRVVDVMRQRAKREGERSTVTVLDRDIEQFIDRCRGVVSEGSVAHLVRIEVNAEYGDANGVALWSVDVFVDGGKEPHYKNSGFVLKGDAIRVARDLEEMLLSVKESVEVVIQ